MCVSVQGSSEVEELEKQLEIQSSIIEASKVHTHTHTCTHTHTHTHTRTHTQTLLSQANTRRLKKDRRKEIKDAVGRHKALEDRIQEIKKEQSGGLGAGSSSRFHVDSPSDGGYGIQTHTHTYTHTMYTACM